MACKVSAPMIGGGCCSITTVFLLVIILTWGSQPEFYWGETIAKIYPINPNSPTVAAFPPTHRLNDGKALALSGGGARAAAVATGALRALHIDQDMMKQVDGIGCASGGCWGSAPYMYQSKYTIAEVLGSTKVTPADLSTFTVENLNKAANTPLNLQGYPQASIRSVIDPVLRGTALKDTWAAAVSKVCLNKFGIGSVNTGLALDQAQLTAITAQNSDGCTTTSRLLRMAGRMLGRRLAAGCSTERVQSQIASNTYNFQQQPSGRHQVYVISGVIMGPSGYKPSTSDVVSFQMSADYIGSPYYPNNAPRTYNSYSGSKTTTKIVGGGLVESFAFGGGAPSTAAGQAGVSGDGSMMQTMLLPSRPFSLAHAVGMSSFSPALAYSNQGQAKAALTSMDNDYFPVTMTAGGAFPKLEGSQKAEQFVFGDGGSLENTGLLSLLQRGATRAAVFLANGVGNPLGGSTSVDLCAAGDPVTTATQPSMLGAFFGYGDEAFLLEDFVMPEAWVYTHNQIFAKAELKALVCNLQTLRDAGKPAVYKSTHTTIQNTWWGIEAGRKITVVWYVNDKCSDFEALLPADTQAAINAGRDKTDVSQYPLASYPLMPTAMWGFSNAQMNLLSRQVQYAVDKNKALYECVYKKANAETCV